MVDAVRGQPAAVNEGPNPLYHAGRTWLSFSASWCGTATYTLGLLAYDGSGDPLQASSWTKSGPAFSAANSNYGTGHNCFFSSPDGRGVERVSCDYESGGELWGGSVYYGADR